MVRKILYRQRLKIFYFAEMMSYLANNSEKYNPTGIAALAKPITIWLAGKVRNWHRERQTRGNHSKDFTISHGYSRL